MFYRCGGMPARQIIEMLNREHGYGLPVREFAAHEKEARFVELLPGIRPVQEVIDVLHRLGAGCGSRMLRRVGDSGCSSDACSFLGLNVGPQEKIKVLVGSDQVLHGKPHPDLFFRAARCSGVETRAVSRFRRRGTGLLKQQKAAGMDYIDIRPFRQTGLHAAAEY